MSEINLDALSLGELKQLEKSVGKAIASFQDRRKTEARAKVDELARELGYSFEDLADAGTPRKRALRWQNTAIPKMPKSPGRAAAAKPGWIRDALAAGKSLDAFAI